MHGALVDLAHVRIDGSAPLVLTVVAVAAIVCWIVYRRRRVVGVVAVAVTVAAFAAQLNANVLGYPTAAAALGHPPATLPAAGAGPGPRPPAREATAAATARRSVLASPPGPVYTVAAAHTTGATLNALCADCLDTAVESRPLFADIDQTLDRLRKHA